MAVLPGPIEFQRRVRRILRERRPLLPSGEPGGIPSSGATPRADGPGGGAPCRHGSCSPTVRAEPWTRGFPSTSTGGGKGGFRSRASLGHPLQRRLRSRGPADLNSDGNHRPGGHELRTRRSDGPRHGAPISSGAHPRDSTSTVRPGPSSPKNHVSSGNVADLDRDGYLDLVLNRFDPAQTIVYYGSATGYHRTRRQVLPSGLDPGRLQPGRLVGPVGKLAGRRGGNLVGRTGRPEPRTGSHRLRALGGQPGNGRSQLRWIPGPDRGGATPTPPPAPSTSDSSSSGDQRRVSRPGTPNGCPAWASWHRSWPTLTGTDSWTCSRPPITAPASASPYPPICSGGAGTACAPMNKTRLVCDSAQRRHGGRFRSGQSPGPGRHLPHPARRPPHRLQGFLQRWEPLHRPQDGGDSRPWGAILIYLTDVGHIYDRSWRQTYESSLFHWTGRRSGGRLTATAETPALSRLSFRIRSGADPSGLEKKAWRRVTGDRFPLESGDRVLQYQAVFESENGDSYPILDRVSIELNSE